MPIRLDSHPIAYYPTHKVASSSVKGALYYVDQGKPWEDYVENGSRRHIHNGWKVCGAVFRPLPRSDPAWRFAVIRDPVDRIVSAYRNRVLFHRDLETGECDSAVWAGLGLTRSPSLDQFVVGLEAYRVVSKNIALHTRPQCVSLGPSLTYYDRIYRIEELSDLANDLGVRTGTRVEMPHLQQGGPAISREELSREALAAIRNLFMGDYVLLRRFYRPPAYRRIPHRPLTPAVDRRRQGL